MISRGKRTGLILLCSSLLCACGYHFAGSGQYPKGVEHIFIEVLENRTSKTGIERTVTNRIIFEFTRQRPGSLAGNPAEADAVLKGTINSIRTQTIAWRGQELASQREVIMTLDMKLVKKSGETVWIANGLSDRQGYDVSAVQQENDRNQDEAISILSERLSERIFARMTDNF